MALVHFWNLQNSLYTYLNFSHRNLCSRRLFLIVYIQPIIPEIGEFWRVRQFPRILCFIWKDEEMIMIPVRILMKVLNCLSDGESCWSDLIQPSFFLAISTHSEESIVLSFLFRVLFCVFFLFCFFFSRANVKELGNSLGRNLISIVFGGKVRKREWHYGVRENSLTE